MKINRLSLAIQIYKALQGREFSIKDAAQVAPDKPQSTVRGRIYDNLGKLFKRVGRGIYVTLDSEHDTAVAMINGDGRDLSMLEDGSMDAIITDHPYEDKKSLKGGNRDFSQYEVFQYTQKDFDEKARVLKDGAFLVEFFAEENANNYDYIYSCKKMAEKAGFKYYCTVPWTKGTFVANTGRKAKNSEQVVIFTKGNPRRLRPDKQRGGLMSGAAGMLPIAFDFQPKPVKQKVHKAEKPVGLLEKIIEYVTLPGEVILDQFAGSGNLGIAALMKNRFAILIEKSKEIFISMARNIHDTFPEEAIA